VLRAQCDQLLDETEVPASVWEAHATPERDPLLGLMRRYVQQRDRFDAMGDLLAAEVEAAYYEEHVSLLWDNLSFWTPPCTSLEGATTAVKLAIEDLDANIGGFGPYLLEAAAAE
jgi:hypothetical protein